MWCTTFAFQPWHSAVEFKRYLVRFAHMVAGFNRLEGIMRTVSNQYDSMVRPLHKWLCARGVIFALNTRVTDLGIARQAGETSGRSNSSATEIPGEIALGASDLVLVTLGSMTEDRALARWIARPSSEGRRTAAPGRYGRRSPRAETSASLGFFRPYRRVEMGLVHDDDARSGTPSDRSRSHRQRARRRRLRDLPGLELARLDRHSPSAAFHRPTRRRQRVLGIRIQRCRLGNFVKSPCPHARDARS